MSPPNTLAPVPLCLPHTLAPVPLWCLTALSTACSHGLALVSGSSSGSPACYLEPDKRLLSVRAPPTGMLVLCVVMPGPALLDIIDNIRQNVSSMT